MKNYDDLTKLSEDALLHLYTADATEESRLDAALGQRGAIYDGIAASVAGCRVMAVYSEVRRRGQDAQRRLLGILHHPDPGVRRTVAWHVMEFAPEEAEPVLQALVAEGGYIGRSTQSGLKAWHEGKTWLSPDVPYPSRPTLTEAERWPAIATDVASILAVASNRLDADTPELAEAFRRASIEKRRQVAVHATERIIAEVGLSDDDVNEAQYALRFEALPAHEHHVRMKALAARLDEDASRLRNDPDPNNRAAAIRLRAEARAVSSLAIALTGDSTRLDEVIHEALAAEDEHEGQVTYLKRTLRE